MGQTDRLIRIVVAIIVVTLYYVEIISGTTAIVLLGLAAVFVLTSVIGVCPLYLPFNIRTRKKD